MYKHNKTKLVQGKLYFVSIEKIFFNSKNKVDYTKYNGALAMLILHNFNLNLKKDLSNHNKTSVLSMIYLNSTVCNKCNKSDHTQTNCYCCHDFLYLSQIISILDYKNVYMGNNKQKHYLVNQLKESL